MTTTHLPDALREELQRLENELALDPRYAKIARIRALLETYEADPTPAPKEAQHRPRPPVFWKSEEDVVIAPLVQKRKHSDDDIQALLPRLPGRNTSQVDARIRRLRIKNKGETAKARQEVAVKPPKHGSIEHPEPMDRPTGRAGGEQQETGHCPVSTLPPADPNIEKEVMPHLPATGTIPVRHGHDNATAPAVAGAEPPTNLAELEARYTTDPICEQRRPPSGDMEPYLNGGIEALTLRPRR